VAICNPNPLEVTITLNLRDPAGNLAATLKNRASLPPRSSPVAHIGFP